jgi:TAT (twin-arginine translocation) pathway signal sequence
MAPEGHFFLENTLMISLSRRSFLTGSTALGALALAAGPQEEARPAPADGAKLKPRGPDGKGWKPHVVKQGDGHGGWAQRSAELQYLRKSGDLTDMTMCFGLAQMDNGQVILAGAWNKEDEKGKSLQPHKPLVAFSRDRGDT